MDFASNKELQEGLLYGFQTFCLCCFLTLESFEGLHLVQLLSPFTFHLLTSNFKPHMLVQLRFKALRLSSICLSFFAIVASHIPHG
jgi:hypothetical protein